MTTAQGGSGAARPLGRPQPLADRILGQLEASPGGCAAVSAHHPQRKIIEADIARFVEVAKPAQRQVHFEVRDCLQDGFVWRGNTIVISSRLAARPAAQRFFIIAHEFAHVQLEHHGEVHSFVARLLDGAPDEGDARARVAGPLTTLSHRHELQADAYAVRLMREAGLDVTQAARLFEDIGSERDTSTHPSPMRRARAIRALTH